MATATKKRKEEAYPWKAGASSGHTTNLKQSILRLSIPMHSIVCLSIALAMFVGETVGIFMSQKCPPYLTRHFYLCLAAQGGRGK
jgi:hypothetical protein